jgi:hypothetical protein
MIITLAIWWRTYLTDSIVRMPFDRLTIPDLPGIIAQDEVLQTAHSIASVQCKNGMIPWFEGGHSDPWNHVEAAMALAVTGMWEEATRAYEWLVSSQLPDGSWFNYYTDAAGVVDQRIDTNVCAYIAVGTWHHYLVTGDLGFLEWIWKVLDRAVAFVLRYQTDNGTILWSVDPDGHSGRYALLTGSSSIYHALRCAIACADTLGYDRRDWKAAARMLGRSLSNPDDGFEPKREFAMDWYYPILCGALNGEAAARRLYSDWDTFVMDGLGVRCVSTGPWVTAAETAECAIALSKLAFGAAGPTASNPTAFNSTDGIGPTASSSTDGIGSTASNSTDIADLTQSISPTGSINQFDKSARDLILWSRNLRREDGSYWTGMVYPEQVTFPIGESTTYTAAAIILAVDSLREGSPTNRVFF